MILGPSTLLASTANGIVLGPSTLLASVANGIVLGPVTLLASVVEGVAPSFTGTLIDWETGLPFAEATGLKMIIRATFEGASLGTMQTFSTDIDGNFSVPYAGAEDATEYFVAITDANETITELHKLTAEA